MNVYCVYTPGDLRNETLNALSRQWQFVEYVEIAKGLQLHSTAYAEVVSDLWDRGETFILIEQDIVVQNDTLRRLWNCSHPWCGFPYSVGGEPNPGMLGCTKFSAKLMREYPDAIRAAMAIRYNTGCMPGCWHRLDCAILQTLEGYGHKFHSHYPAVQHLHNYSGKIDD